MELDEGKPLKPFIPIFSIRGKVIHYPNLIILGIEASGFTVVATIGLLHLFQGENS